MIISHFNYQYIENILKKVHEIKFISVLGDELNETVGIMTLVFMPVHRDELYKVFQYCQDNKIPSKTMLSVIAKEIDLIVTIYNLNTPFYIQFQSENYNKANAEQFIQFLKFKSSNKIINIVLYDSDPVQIKEEWRFITLK